MRLQTQLTMSKLISVDFRADFGFFRKPDANNTINLSYNILHKPALLGILGAIIGLDGYKEKGKMPGYYNALKDVKIGVEPIGQQKGIFNKIVIKYTDSTGFNNIDKDNQPCTRVIEGEATLIKPAYRVYLLLNLENAYQNKLHEYLQAGKAEYLPYFGKNEYSAWWEVESFKDYILEETKVENKSKTIKTLFLKKHVINDVKDDLLVDLFNFEKEEVPYFYFERLPMGFNEELMQYEIGDYVFGTYKIKNNIQLDNLYYLKSENAYVQLL